MIFRLQVMYNNQISDFQMAHSLDDAIQIHTFLIKDSCFATECFLILQSKSANF